LVSDFPFPPGHGNMPPLPNSVSDERNTVLVNVHQAWADFI
jgi:hypothetical protein